MPHALDPEKGFRVRSRFIFEDFIGTAQPTSPAALARRHHFCRLWVDAKSSLTMLENFCGIFWK
jgi:hypothetical protein